MFAYPNAGHQDQTLAQTIEHYLSDSMQRENAGAFLVVAQESDALCTVTITGEDGDTVNQIGQRYQAFYDIGQIGLQAAAAFRSSGKWDPQWQFFLPVGVAPRLRQSRRGHGLPSPHPITLVSALIAHLAVGDGVQAWGWAVGTGVLWAASYFFWRRLLKLRVMRSAAKIDASY